MHIPELKLPMNTVAIQKCIPHRFPFLLIDKVISLTPNESIVAIKNVSISDPILQGHFPNQPVYPGVLIVEGIAQTAGVLCLYSVQQKFDNILLGEIQNARFRQVVEPGATLHYEVKIEKKRGTFYWFKGQALLENEVAASVSFSAFMK